MTTPSYIDHAGFISSIRSGVAYISLIQTSACTSCSVKGVCGAATSEHKRFEISINDDQWEVGEEVVVRLNTSTGFLALLIAYIIPVVLVITTLLFLLYAGVSEETTGVIALVALLPYYSLVFLFRLQLKKKLTLKILKR